ncbi:MAG: hypothetical protein AB1344_11455 [Pseudomonadota bacterium]
MAVLLGTTVLAACGGGGADSAQPGSPACGSWPTSVMLPQDMPGSVIASVAIVDACHMLVAGHFGAANPFEPSGNTKGFVLRWRLDAHGQVHEDWRHVLDGAGTDAITSVEWVEGGIRFLGWSDGVEPGDVAYGQRDVLIGQLAADGASKRLSRVGNERPNRPLALLASEPGRAFLVGNDDVHVPTNYVEAWEEPWVAGLGLEDGQYRMDWLVPTGSEDPDTYFAAHVIPGPSFAVALARGRFAGAERGLSVEARDAHGNPLWLTPLTQSPYDNIAGLVEEPSGGLLVFGSSYQDLGGGIAGGSDLFIAGLSMPDGALSWIRSFGSPETDWAAAVAPSGDSLYAVSEVFGPGFSAWRVRLARVSFNGEVLSEQTLVESARGVVKAAAVTGTQLVVVGGIDDGAGSVRGWARFVAREGS